MSLPLADIGDALVTAIRAFRVDLPTENIARHYISDWKLGDVATLQITVAPMSEEPTLVARKVNEKKYTFLIVFRHRLSGPSNEARTEQIDGLLEAVQDLMDELTRTGNETMGPGKWNGVVTRDDLLVREHVNEWNQFTAWFGLEYLKHIARA